MLKSVLCYQPPYYLICFPSCLSIDMFHYSSVMSSLCNPCYVHAFFINLLFSDSSLPNFDLYFVDFCAFYIAYFNLAL